MLKMATNKTNMKTTGLKPGQLWHTLKDTLTTDEEETEDDDDLNQDNNETMKLRREDMPLFGICPAWDQFYLVVCEYCKQVIKPQALQRHIELRHSYHNHISSPTLSNSLKMRNKSTIATGVTTTTTKTTTTITANGSDTRNNNSIKLNESDESSVTPTACDNSVNNKLSLSERNNANSKTKSKCSTDLLSPNTSTPSVPEPTGPGPGLGSTASSECISISVPEINLNKVTDSTNETDITIVTKPNAKKKSYKKPTTPSTRKLLPCKDRLYDPNKHCGVWPQDQDKPCTRSLTCKTHSLTLRRAVQGRIKNFDELLAEHREAKEAALRAQGIEVKPTKKAILKQQQLLKTSQLKTEPNQQLISDNNNSSQQQTRTQLFSESDMSLVQSQSIPTSVNTISNTNSLLTSVVSTPASMSETARSPQVHHNLNQIHSHPNGMSMSCHPRPAAVCCHNMRSVGQQTRLNGRSLDLTYASLRLLFNSPSIVSKIANNSKCSSASSPVSVKSPLRNTNQTYPPTKKLCASIKTEFDSESDSVSDPYNFPDATNPNSAFTYIKPKTTIAKSTSNTSSKKKKKSDINSTSDHSSLLSNGQLFHLSNTNKTVGTNSPKKNPEKKTNSNSHTTSISTTVSVMNNSSNNNNTINLNNSNSDQQLLYYPSTSLISEVPHRNLNDILSNSIDSSKSDNGSILLNGSLLSYKNNSTLGKQNNNNTTNTKESINKNTIFSATKNYNSNKLALNKVSNPSLSSISTTISVSPQSRPILQKQSLPSTPVNASQSQNVSQLTHNIHNTTHTIFIKSPKQSLQHQLTATIPSAKLLSKSDNYPT